MQIVIPTHFGVESLVKEELLALKYAPEFIRANNGQVTLEIQPAGVASAVARCNIRIRTGERILLSFAKAKVCTFDELFDFSKTVLWEDFIPKGWAFHVNGYSRKSALFGIPACQRIIKKAMVDRLSARYKINPGTSLPEDSLEGMVKVEFSIVDDVVTFMIDTSGNGLHKRGYRPLAHIAPIKETLAAALVILSKWEEGRQEALLDPFCGSGTIPIESALISMNIAPGMNRRFSSEKLPLVGMDAFRVAREEALDLQQFRQEKSPLIFGSDIDGRNVKLSQENAQRADVSHIVSFREDDATSLDSAKIQSRTGTQKTLIIANPPYGERVLEIEQARALFKQIGRCWLENGKARQGLRISIIAPYASFESDFGGVADKRRKLYNGMIPCNMFHYFKHLKGGY